MSSLSASKEVAIRIRDVSITYRANLQKAPTLKNTLVSMGRRQSTIREIHALKNVSFDIHQGQVMGVIGANGAGKSTLMRTVAGILAPSTGRIDVYGRVSTLLALGVGFNSALSGKENVVLGGLAAGLTRKEIDRRFERPASVATPRRTPYLAASNSTESRT